MAALSMLLQISRQLCADFEYEILDHLFGLTLSVLIKAILRSESGKFFE
jgi:hypothetical protein